MRLVHAGVLDDGGGQEQEWRNLGEGESVLVSGRGLSLRRLGLDRFSLDGQCCVHSRANITRRASRQAIRPAMAARRHRWTNIPASQTEKERVYLHLPDHATGSKRLKNQGGAHDDLQADQIQATVETIPMLLTDDQIAGALRERRDRLTQLDVAIVGIEAKEEPPVELPPSLEYPD